jgi:hypothetical protein
MGSAIICLALPAERNKPSRTVLQITRKTCGAPMIVWNASVAYAYQNGKSASARRCGGDDQNERGFRRDLPMSRDYRLARAGSQVGSQVGKKTLPDLIREISEDMQETPV